jgi:hypothetical protein
MSNDQLGYHEKPVDNRGAREEYTGPVPAVLLTIKRMQDEDIDFVMSIN